MADWAASIAGERWIISAALLLIWIGLSYFWLGKRSGAAAAGVLVIHASQTGHAGELAGSAHRRISASGVEARLINISDLTAPMLVSAKRILLLVSTTGHGDAPDPARTFERKLMAQDLKLKSLETAVLALGDREYPDFCAFGVRLDDWLKKCGAQPLAPMVMVDDLSHDDLAIWDEVLSDIGYPRDDSEQSAALIAWTVIERELVANGDADGEKSSHGSGHNASRSDGLYRIRLEPKQQAGALEKWQIGDLFELTTPDGHKRDYSIANRDHRRGVELFVRRVALAGSGVGRGSGLLTGADQEPQEILGRIRNYDQFRPTTSQGPLLAVAAGSGWAGIRPHVIEAYENTREIWLIFGDRGHVEGEPLLEEMRRWEKYGHLGRLDLALSRLRPRSAGGAGRYVQHIIADEEQSIGKFLTPSGSVVLCGGLAMGEGVIAAISQSVGEQWIEQARAAGRWRQELY